jgi:UDPglucose 6-dehydrogenase
MEYTTIKKQGAQVSKNAIGVIGQGFVGGSITTVFSERGFHVYAYDKAGITAPGAHELSNKWSLRGMVDYAERVASTKGESFSGVYFVCVPTPMRRDGSADLSIVESVLEELAEIPGDRIAVVKSTVPPGSTRRWNQMYNRMGLTVVFNPEFLTEANAVEDMRNQNRIIVGGPRPASSKVKQVFRAAFPEVNIIKTGSTEAETVKYFTNCFLATKVSFANEMYQMCDRLDIDYDKVVEYALYDKRIGSTHLSVPGPDGSYGFGGHCFPKDLNAIVYLCKELGITPSVLEGVWKKNSEVRDDRDWERMKGRAISEE